MRLPSWPLLVAVVAAPAGADKIPIPEGEVPAVGAVKSKAGGKLGSTGWVIPVPDHPDGRHARISSGWEMRTGPDGEEGTADDYRHGGLDFMWRKPKCTKQKLPWESKCYEMLPETSALAAQDGEVVISEEGDKGGLVRLEHAGGVKTEYNHLSSRHVAKGDKVSAGQSVGIIGWNVNGYRLAHLHFALLIDGRYVNPEPYVKGWAHLAAPVASPTAP